jgi:hypothetical protein
MATELQTSSPDSTSLTGLVTGIVNDAQELLQQQSRLIFLHRLGLRLKVRKEKSD